MAKVAPASSLVPLEAFFDRGHADIMQSTIAGVGGILYTAIVLSEKTGVHWALHSKGRGDLASKLVTFKLMYDAHFAATNGTMLFFAQIMIKQFFLLPHRLFGMGLGLSANCPLSILRIETVARNLPSERCIWLPVP